MKNKNTINYSDNFSRLFGRGLLNCLIISFIFFLNSCVDFEEPGTIYESSYPSTNNPSITEITPAGVALGGVREIRISGQNLGVKNDSDTDWVFIGGVRARIKEIIGNQTIVVHRPQLPNSNYNTKIYVSVTAPQAIDMSSNIEYMVESPGEIIGDYATINAIVAADFDRQENIYVIAGRNIYRNDPSGVTLTQIIGSLPTSLRVTDAKFGPGTVGVNLYVAGGTDILYRTRVDSNVSRVAVDTLPGNVNVLDFDENGNIYSGGSNGIFMSNLSEGTTTPQSLGYEGINNKGIRVVNGFIYVADSLNVWRSSINSDGTLSGQEQLVSLNNQPALSGCFINSFAIDENNNIYLSIRNHPTHSLFFRENDGSVSPYYYENILPNTVDRLVWGNNNYLYLISSALGPNGVPVAAAPFASGRIFRMAVDKNGAPYQGRKFLP